jgi:sulfoxide reductase heme-binding subunit YedZ
MGNGSGTYRIRRTSRFVLLCAIAATICAIAYVLTPPPDIRHRLSMGTAYAALCYLAASLVLGPWNVLRARPTPLSYDQRRDVGIIAGILALLHTAIGLTVHLRGRMWMYFIKGFEPLRLQAGAFGVANYLGLAAAIIFAVLLAISNDRSLRALGTRRWKRLQRYTYAAFGLTLAHSALYQFVEKRLLPWVVVFAAITLITTLCQCLGFWRRRRHAA